MELTDDPTQKGANLASRYSLLPHHLALRTQSTSWGRLYPKHFVGPALRRAFLGGIDHYSGQSYEHRRQWVVDRIRLLCSLFEFIHARRFNRLKPSIDTGQAIPLQLIQENKLLFKGYGRLWQESDYFAAALIFRAKNQYYLSLTMRKGKAFVQFSSAKVRVCVPLICAANMC